MARTSCSLGKQQIHLHHPLEVCIGKHRYTLERGAGLGWDVNASGSVICLDLPYNVISYSVMARTSRSLGK
jgi:hypothetical protein